MPRVLTTLLLLGLATLSMVAPALVQSFVPREYSPFWTPGIFLASDLVILPIAAIWFWLFFQTYRTAGIHRKRVLWFLVLVPFVLYYPAWLAIVLTCAWFFNWCGGTPL
jgi:hypothetical protein